MIMRSQRLRPPRSRQRFHPDVGWICALLLAGGAAQEAQASYYAFSASPLTAPATFGKWTLADYGGLPGMSGAGIAVSPKPGTIVLTGINDGSFVPGWTGLLVPAVGAGLFSFDYLFSTLDDPHYQYAGYIVQSPGRNLIASQVFLADTDGQSGSVSVPVVAGQMIGFYAGGDDQGGLHGVLTVANFSAPVPEPAAFQLMLTAGLAAGIVPVLRRARQRHRLRRLLPTVVVHSVNANSIWMAVECIGNYPRTDYANWNTHIIRRQP